MNCGIEESQVVFLFSDTQITNEVFVEDINNILNNGEIPNLYQPDDVIAIQESIKETHKNNPAMKNLLESPTQIMQLFAN